MILVFDPVCDVLLAAILATYLHRRPGIASKSEPVPARPRIDEYAPIHPLPPAAPAPEPPPPATHHNPGLIEIVRIIPEGGYSRTGMVREVGHPDIAEALTHESLAILRPDGNVEITSGEIEVAPNVR